MSRHVYSYISSNKILEPLYNVHCFTAFILEATMERSDSSSSIRPNNNDAPQLRWQQEDNHSEVSPLPRWEEVSQVSTGTSNSPVEVTHRNNVTPIPQYQGSRHSNDTSPHPPWQDDRSVGQSSTQDQWQKNRPNSNFAPELYTQQGRRPRSNFTPDPQQSQDNSSNSYVSLLQHRQYVRSNSYIVPRQQEQPTGSRSITRSNSSMAPERQALRGSKPNSSVAPQDRRWVDEKRQLQNNGPARPVVPQEQQWQEAKANITTPVQHQPWHQEEEPSYDDAPPPAYELEAPDGSVPMKGRTGATGRRTTKR
jgi:hypothetical protein